VVVAVEVMSIGKMAPVDNMARLVGLASDFVGTETSFVNLDLGLWEIVDSALARYFVYIDCLDSCRSFHFTRYKVLGSHYSVEIRPGQENQHPVPYRGQSLLLL
jgi:hypothetical protein